MPPLEPLILSALGSQGTRADLAKLVFLGGAAAVWVPGSCTLTKPFLFNFDALLLC